MLRVLQESETPVGVGTPLLEIADPTDLEIVIDVLSSDGRRIASGARVDIDAGPGPRLTGRVRRIDGHARKRRVKVGGRTASDAWIEDGLAPGERVIVYPSDSVAEGKRLKVVRGSA